MKYHNKKLFPRYYKFKFNKKLNAKKKLTNKNIQRAKLFQKIMDKNKLYNDKNEKNEINYKNHIKTKSNEQIPLFKNKDSFCSDNKFLFKKIDINLYYIDNNNEETIDKSEGSNYSTYNNSGKDIRKIIDGNYFHIKNFKYYAYSKKKNNKRQETFNHSCDKFKLLQRCSLFNLN